jgi:arylsulfatase A-like enzyme
MVTLADIAPTILEYCGLDEAAEEASMDGLSLRSLIDNGSHAGARDGVYLTENAWMRKRGWRTPRWKLIVETGHTPEVYGRSDDELYDLVVDPDEQDNLIEKRPAVADGLRADMQAHLSSRLKETGLPDPTEEQDITLRNIGSLETAVPKDQIFGDDGDDA